jgi:hypothetical protein
MPTLCKVALRAFLGFIFVAPVCYCLDVFLLVNGVDRSTCFLFWLSVIYAVSFALLYMLDKRLKILLKEEQMCAERYNAK